MKNLMLGILIASIGFTAVTHAANPLKGGISTSVDPDYASEIQPVFKRFQTLMTSGDINVMNLFDPQARMRFECQSPDGPQTITLTGSQMRQYQQVFWRLNPSLMTIPMASFRPVQSVNPKTKAVPMIRIDYQLTATTTAPVDYRAFTVVMARQPVKNKKGKTLRYDWRIISLESTLDDPQRLNTQILTALQDPKKQQQIEQLIQSLAAYSTPVTENTSTPASHSPNPPDPNDRDKDRRERNQKPWLKSAHQPETKPESSETASAASVEPTAKATSENPKP